MRKVSPWSQIVWILVWRMNAFEAAYLDFNSGTYFQKKMLPCQPIIHQVLNLTSCPWGMWTTSRRSSDSERKFGLGWTNKNLVKLDGFRFECAYRTQLYDCRWPKLCDANAFVLHLKLKCGGDYTMTTMSDQTRFCLPIDAWTLIAS